MTALKTTPTDAGNALRAPAAHLSLPFFDEAHRTLARDLVDWAPAQDVDEHDDRAACRKWVRRLGDSGWLRYCVPAAHGGALTELDSRALVILRETLAFHSPLADFAFAMQGLGSGAITLAGTPAQQAAYLPAVARGEKIAAFALSETDAGSDVAAMKTIANYNHSTLGNDPKSLNFTLKGEKTWISNGGIADFTACSPRPSRRPARGASPPSLSMPPRRGWTPRSTSTSWPRTRWPR